MLTPFDFPHVGAFDTSVMGQRFLGQALLYPHFAYGGAEGSPGRRFVGCATGGPSPLNRTLLHQQKRDSIALIKPR